MQTLELNTENASGSPKRKFWARQFQEIPTGSQKRFDWAFGVVLPVICFYFDPLIFKGQLWGLAMFASFKPFAYLLFFASIISMTIWLLWRERLGRWAAPLAGVFVVGGFVSICVGIMIFPLSLVGLMLLIGALGFTPLITGVIYLRNASRALNAARSLDQNTIIVPSLLISTALAAFVPLAVNAEIAKSLERIKSVDQATFHKEAAKLRLAGPLVNFDQLALHYHRSDKAERESEGMRRIAEFYAEMTGGDIEKTVAIMMD